MSNIYFSFVSKKIVFPMILFLTFNFILNAGIIEKTYYFEKPVLSERNGFDYLEMNDSSFLEEPTKPLVPMRTVRLLLLPGEQAINVEVTSGQKIRIGEGYNLYPAQYDTPVSLSYLRKFTEPDIDVYSSNEIYPSVMNSRINTDYYRGHSIAVVDIYPVQYLLAKGELFYFSEMSVTITSSSTSEAAGSYNELYRSDDHTRKIIREFTHNPERLSSYPIQNNIREDYDTTLLIITTNDFEDDFAEFVKFKKLQGYNTAIETVEDIYASYSGFDDQDEIRLCIKDYYQNHGTDFVILGGDTENIPHRGLYGHVWVGGDPDPVHETDNDIPADIYYAALDRVGTGAGPDWNVDNDSMWGEYDVGDPDYGDITEADFLSEVYIGRICADSNTEFANCLNKQIMYQKTPVTADNKKAIMVGEKMWDGWCGDEHKEEVRLGGTYDGYTTAGLEDEGIVSQLQYAHTYPDSSWPVADLIAKMNDGTTFINHLGHGNVGGYMGFGVSNNTVEQLTSNGENHNFYFIYSQTCYGSSFDDRYPNGSYASNDCMTEKFTTYEDGVLGVAGNSRYGLTGAGQRFDRYFFDAMCKSTDPQYIVSYMQEWSKFYAGYDTYGKRWTYYELNLFADPTLEFWKYSSLSSVLSVSVLTTPTIGMDQMTVQVGPAVLGMKVSICTENGIFGTGYTNASGNATINFNQPLNSEEIIYGMVTHESYLPYEFQTGWLPGIWTGEYSTSWHYFGNWEYEFVPASGDDVQIPSGTPNDPQIASSNAICRNLTIDSGASLTITGRTLDVEEDVTISGELVMDHNLSKLEVLENLIWSSGSTANITNPFIEIIVSGYFSFNSGADVQLENGDVRLSGGSNSALTSYDENCYMNNLRILKSGAQVNISGEFAETLNIHGDLFINSTSTLINFYPNNDILLKGDLNSQGNCMLQYGNLTFDGTIQSITTNSGDYFNDITFNSSSYAQLQSDVWIKGDVEFDMGSLDANGYDISIEGDWLTNFYYPSAFDAGTGTVTFNGTDDQICNGSSFNILKLYKPSGELIIQNVGRSMVQCNSYDWTQGILTIDGGMMTMSDLVNNGFYGTTQVISGTLNIFQDVNQYVDLNGSLIIYDGAVNVNGGDDTSYWPYSEDAYLYMEGGTLDFKDHSININTSYAFSHVISGGTIRATGDFTIERHDFHPTGGRVELYGSEGANIDLGSWGNYLHILEIDKETSRSNNDAKIISNSRNFDDSVSKKNTSRRPETLVYETSRTNSITVQSDLEIHDNLYIDNGTYILNGNTVEVLGDAWISGTLEMTNSLDHLDVTGDVDWQSGSSDNITAGEISLEGDWEFSGGTTASLGIGNTVRIDGTGTSQITIAEFDNASFGTVILDKTSGLTEQSTYYSAYLKIDGNLTLSENDVFNAYRVQLTGELFMDSGSELYMSGGDFDVFSAVECNGHLNLEGGYFTASDAFLLTSVGEMIIDGGNCTLDRPYTGNFMSFVGVLNILDGYLEITYDGIQFATGATPNMTDGFIRVGGHFRANQPNAFHPTGGTIEFMNTEWSTIQCNNGNYFYNLEIDKVYATRGCYISDDLTINNDLFLISGKLQGSGYEITVNNDVTIESSGVLDPDDELLKVGRWWTNNRGAAGFVEGSGTVELFGSLVGQIKTDETFYDLTLNKTTGNMYYTEIRGTKTVHVENDLHIDDGKLLLRENGTLDIDQDLILQDDTGLRCIVGETGINIEIGHYLYDYNTDNTDYTSFQPGNSTVTFDGSTNQICQSFRTSYDFYHLIIDQTADYFYPYTELVVQGDMTVTDGCWNNPSTGMIHTFMGDVDICASGWNSNYGTVVFSGAEEATYQKGSGVVHHNVIVDKTSYRNDEEKRNNIQTRTAETLTLLTDIYCLWEGDLTVSSGTLESNGHTISCSGDITINGGKLALDDNSRLRVGNDKILSVSNGGILESIGSAGNEVDITCYNSGYYHDISIDNGGTIAAEYTTFQYMADNGVYVTFWGTVDTDHSFQNCTFQNGIYNGYLLRIRNDQDLTVNDAVFPDNTWGSLYNVYKNINQGNVEFLNATGDFSGESYDYDPYSRIDWTTVVPPGISVSPSSIDFGDVIVGETERDGFYIENIGGATLTGTITTPEGFTVIDLSREGNPITTNRNQISFSVEPEDTEPYAVDFSPLLEQTYSGDIVITHNASSPDETVFVTGNGTPAPPPEIDVWPDTLNFGDVLIGTIDSLWLNIYNSGGSNLIGTITTPTGYTVTEMIFRNRQTDESRRISNPNYRNILPFDIPAGWYMDFDVAFEPTAMQDYNDDIIIEHNADEVDYLVQCLGRGVEAKFTFNPYVINKTLESGESDIDTLTFGNEGNLDIDYLAYIEYEEYRSTIIQEGFEGSFPPTGWSLESLDGWGNWEQNSGNQYSGTYCTQADPMMVDDARLITPFFTATEDCILRYYIRAYDPWYFWENAVFEVEITTDGMYWTTLDSFLQDTITDEYILKGLTLGDYAGQNVKIAFRIQYNSMGSGINIDDVMITGDASPTYSWLSLDGGLNISGTIPVGSPDIDIPVGFDTAELSDGSYYAYIRLISNDTSDPYDNVAIVLNVGTYDLTIDPASLDFGDVEVGQIPVLQFSLENTGTLELNGEIITPTGYTVEEDFPVRSGKQDSNDRNSIYYFLFPGDTLHYDVTFEPESIQNYDGNIQITILGTDDEALPVFGSGISSVPPDTPANLTIEIVGTNVVLNWDSVAGADSYKVYSSDDPNESYENWDFEEEVTATTWSEAIPSTKKFYYVTAVSTSRNNEN